MEGTIKWGPPPMPETPGDAIIEAFIKVGAIRDVEVLEEGTIFIWEANASEQLEAAMRDFGYKITKVRKHA